MVLIADSQDNLQRLTFKLTERAEKYNMMSSKDKTKAMVISKEPIRYKSEIKQKIIEQVMKLTYPAVEI